MTEYNCILTSGIHWAHKNRYFCDTNVSELYWILTSLGKNKFFLWICVYTLVKYYGSKSISMNFQNCFSYVLHKKSENYTLQKFLKICVPTGWTNNKVIKIWFCFVISSSAMEETFVLKKKLLSLYVCASRNAYLLIRNHPGLKYLTWCQFFLEHLLYKLQISLFQFNTYLHPQIYFCNTVNQIKSNQSINENWSSWTVDVYFLSANIQCYSGAQICTNIW